MRRLTYASRAPLLHQAIPFASHGHHIARFDVAEAFDGVWLKAAGLTHEQFVEVVKNSLTDGQVCDWVRLNVKKTQAEKDAHWADVLCRPLANDEAALARLKLRKEQAGIAHRDDVKCFVDMLDADEKRI